MSSLNDYIMLRRNLGIGAGVAAGLGLLLVAGLFSSENSATPLIGKQARNGSMAVLAVLLGGIIAVMVYGGQVAQEASDDVSVLDRRLVMLLKQYSETSTDDETAKVLHSEIIAVAAKRTQLNNADAPPPPQDKNPDDKFIETISDPAQYPFQPADE